MVYVLFSPNYGLEVNLEPELAYSPDIPPDIDQFWTAFSILWFNPVADIGGIAAGIIPTDLKNVPPHLN
jgi:hypothetical protein